MLPRSGPVSPESTVAESHKVELTFGFGRERSHASVVYGFGFPGSNYP